MTKCSKHDLIQWALDEWAEKANKKPIKEWDPLPEGVSHIKYPNGIMITMPERLMKELEDAGWRCD